jgi:hypothetical protein
MKKIRIGNTAKNGNLPGSVSAANLTLYNFFLFFRLLEIESSATNAEDLLKDFF